MSTLVDTSGAPLGGNPLSATGGQAITQPDQAFFKDLN